MTDVAVAFDRVDKRYGRTVALRGLSGAIARGEMFGLIGPDGAGKTTTVRLVCGLIRPDAGTVRVLGRDPVRDHRAITGAVGYLSQRFSLYGDLSIDENLAFFAEIHRVRDYGARRDRLLEITHLTPFRARLADRLSGGMKQKLALACTLIHEPELLILDEPTTGLDPAVRLALWERIRELRDGGTTVLLTTHYMDEAERLCDRLAILDGGRVVAEGAPAALIRAHLAPQALELALSDAEEEHVLRGLDGLDGVRRLRTGRRLVLYVSDAGALLERLRHRGSLADPRSVVVRPANLEDVFLALTGTRLEGGA